MHKISNPKVSIVIPSYGGGENLARSLDSVLSQEYDNWECFIVDDNGENTPNQIQTANVVREYIKDPRINYVCHKKNINGSAARNTGIRMSTGEFFCVLDDDDAYEPNFLSIQVPILSTLPKEYPLTYVSKADYVNGELYGVLHASTNDQVDMITLFTDEFPIGACSFLMRREVYDKVGGYDESFIRHQDWEFLDKVLAQYKLAKGIDVVCYRRYLTKRNNPKNSYLAKQYRDHYLAKMKVFIDQFPKKDQKVIYDVHFAKLSFTYIMNGDFSLFFKELWRQKPGIAAYTIWGKKLLFILKKGKLRA